LVGALVINLTRFRESSASKTVSFWKKLLVEAPGRFLAVELIDVAFNTRYINRNAPCDKIYAGGMFSLSVCGA
jgi:hypothetical protein